MRSLLVLVFVPLASLGALAACGNTSDAEPETPTPTPTPPARDSSTNPSTDAGDASANPTKPGFVAALARASTKTIQLEATFLQAPFTDPSCSVTSEGPCTVTVCKQRDGGAPSLPVYASAGRVRFTGGKPSAEVAVMPDEMRRYTGVFEPYDGAPLLGGEAIELEASGADVPAFSVAATYPALLTLATPSPAAPGPITVRRDRDLEMSWSRGAPGVSLEISILAGSVGDNRRTTCRLPSESGRGSIPASVLSPFPAGTDLDVLTWATRKQKVGDFDVELVVAGEVFAGATNAVVRMKLE